MASLDARLWKWIDQYHTRSDDVGRLARRLLREGIHLGRDTIYHNGFRPLKPRASIGGHSGRF